MKQGKLPNIFAKSMLKKRGVALNVPMMSRREFFKPHKATHPPPMHLPNQPAQLAR